MPIVIVIQYIVIVKIYKKKKGIFRSKSALRSPLYLLYSTSSSMDAQTLFDVQLGKGQEKCSSFGPLDFFQMCLTSVEGLSADMMEVYLSIGVSGVAENLGIQGLQVKVLEMATRGAQKGQVSIAAGKPKIVSSLPSLGMNGMTGAEISALNTKLLAARSVEAVNFVDKVVLEAAGKLEVLADHPCLSGVVNPTEAQKKLFAAVENGQSTCYNLAQAAAFRIAPIQDPTRLPNPPTDAEAASCFQTIRTVVNSAVGAPQSVDQVMLQTVFDRMYLSDIPSLAPTIAAAKNKNLSDWFDQSQACLGNNKILSEFVCKAVSDASLHPNFGTDADRNVHIKKAVHFALMIDAVTETISKDVDGQAILTEIIAKMNSVRPPNWIAKGKLIPFEIAKILTIIDWISMM